MGWKKIGIIALTAIITAFFTTITTRLVNDGYNAIRKELTGR